MGSVSVLGRFDWKYEPFKPAIKNVKLVLINLPITCRALFSAKKAGSSVLRDSRSWPLFLFVVSTVILVDFVVMGSECEVESMIRQLIAKFGIYRKLVRVYPFYHFPD